MSDLDNYRLQMIDVRKSLTLEEINWVNSAMEGKKKNSTVMWLLWLFTGSLGGHRYYLGDSRFGIRMTALWLFCLLPFFSGIFYALLFPAVFAIIDAFFINNRLEFINLLLEINTINYVKGYSKEI
jgi:hypothetical protein